MKIFLATAAIVAAIVLGPIATDWLRAPSAEEALIQRTLYER